MLYQSSESQIMKYGVKDVIAASCEGAQIIDPPWGGAIVPFRGL